MSFRLAWCPSKFCRFQCNYDESIPEYKPAEATTAVQYRNTCPICGCPLVIYLSLAKKEAIADDEAEERGYND